MKITSYNRHAGRKAREKKHLPDDVVGVGYQREGLTGKRIPGVVLTLYFDGRVYILEMDEQEAKDFEFRVSGMVRRT